MYIKISIKKQCKVVFEIGQFAQKLKSSKSVDLNLNCPH